MVSPRSAAPTRAPSTGTWSRTSAGAASSTSTASWFRRTGPGSSELPAADQRAVADPPGHSRHRARHLPETIEPDLFLGRTRLEQRDEAPFSKCERDESIAISLLDAVQRELANLAEDPALREAVQRKRK